MSKQFAQFGGDDGGDHRREVWRLLWHAGRGLPPHQADERRAEFLRSLLPASETCFAHLPVLIGPCGPGRAWMLFWAITGVLGVPAGVAARRLEEFVRKGEAA